MLQKTWVHPYYTMSESKHLLAWLSAAFFGVSFDSRTLLVALRVLPPVALGVSWTFETRRSLAPTRPCHSNVDNPIKNDALKVR